MSVAGCDNPTELSQIIPAVHGRIVFLSDRDSTFIPDVYVMTATGARQTRLTREGYNIGPVWSPDGTKIAWIRDRGLDPGLHVMNSDGTDQRNLTPNLVAWGPSWSPDGHVIAFASHVETDGFWSDQIFTVKLDGSEPVRLTTTKPGGYNPVWSPDGTAIAYLGSPSLGSNRTGPVRRC